MSKMLGSVAHASLSGCCVAAVKRHGKHPTECAAVGSRQSRYRGARLHDCSEGPSTSSSPSIHSFTTFPVTHKRRYRVECSASKEDLASSASKRTPPPPPLSSLGADLAEVLESQPEQFEELIEEKVRSLFFLRYLARANCFCSQRLLLSHVRATRRMIIYIRTRYATDDEIHRVESPRSTLRSLQSLATNFKWILSVCCKYF
jgi:hypothetical protein